MSENWENPSMLFKIADEIGHNRLFGFRYTRYIKTLGLKGNEDLLDFGSGSGAGSKYLAESLQNGGHLTCVDTSRYWSAKAKERMRKYNNVTFCADSLLNLNFPAERFDAIYIHYALHEVSENLREGIVKEFYRILKSDGHLYIKEPQRAYDGMTVEEIRRLMLSNKFVKQYGKEKSGAFSGVYMKNKEC